MKGLQQVLHEVWVSQIHKEGWDFRIEPSHLEDGYNLTLISPGDEGESNTSHHWLPASMISQSWGTVNGLSEIIDGL